MQTFGRDLRFGVRVLLKNRTSTVAAVLMLAVAIAANMMVFGVVNELVLNALPYPEPERVVQIWEVSPSTDHQPSTLSAHNFVDWKEQAGSFEAMAVYAYSNLTLFDEDGPTPLNAVRISSDFFSVFGVEPAFGRIPSPEEMEGKVAILSHHAWQNRFAADPALLGSKVVLDGEPHTVAAVMPPDFKFPSRSTEAWVPPAFRLEALGRGDHFLFGVARLKRGVALAAAQGEVTAIAEELAEFYPRFNEDSGVLLIPLDEQVIGDRGRDLFLLQGATVLFLLIACANVANLLLSRAVERQREMSIRLAIGASRSRLVRQLMAETALLAGVSGAGGLLLALWGSRVLGTTGTIGILRIDRLPLDPATLGFTLAVTLATALICGLAPALHGSRSDLSPLLKESGSQMQHGRFKLRLPKVLVGFQFVVVVVLLVASVLLLSTLSSLRRVDVGFEPEGLVTMKLMLPSSRYPAPWETFELVAERLRGMTEVAGVAGVSDLPFSGSRTQVSFEIPGLPLEVGEARHADYRIVMGDYFEVMGLALLSGRSFGLGDGPLSPPVAVVNDAFARRYLRSEESIGTSLSIHGKPTRIVGVVESLRHESLAGEQTAEVYVPFSQSDPPEWAFMVLRSDLELEALAPILRSSVREVIPEHPIYNLQTMEDRLSGSVAPQRRLAIVFTSFAGLSLVIALVGIYAAIAYAAKRRSLEVAIRLALGARRADIVRIIVLNAFVPSALGILGGVAAAILGSRLLRTMLFGVSPTEPLVLTLVALFLAGAALLACLPPARRATALDPQSIIRSG